MVREESMEKFIGYQRLAVWFVFTLLMLSIIFSGLYPKITGREFTSQLDDILTFSIVGTGTLFIFFMTFVFPRKYPEEFEEYYRKPIREKPEVKKAMKTLLFVLVFFWIMIAFMTIFFIYMVLDSGFVPEEDLKMGILAALLNILALLGCFFIYIVMKK